MATCKRVVSGGRLSQVRFPRRTAANRTQGSAFIEPQPHVGDAGRGWRRGRPVALVLVRRARSFPGTVGASNRMPVATRRSRPWARAVEFVGPRVSRRARRTAPTSPAPPAADPPPLLCSAVLPPFASVHPILQSRAPPRTTTTTPPPRALALRARALAWTRGPAYVTTCARRVRPNCRTPSAALPASRFSELQIFSRCGCLCDRWASPSETLTLAQPEPVTVRALDQQRKATGRVAGSYRAVPASFFPVR